MGPMEPLIGMDPLGAMVPFQWKRVFHSLKTGFLGKVHGSAYFEGPPFWWVLRGRQQQKGCPILGDTLYLFACLQEHHKDNHHSVVLGGGWGGIRDTPISMTERVT